MVLGLSGLANAWRAWAEFWSVSSDIAHILTTVSTAVWLVLVLLYVTKWIVLREHALREIEDTIQCCFVGLVGVAAMLVAGGLQSFNHAMAMTLFSAGAVYTASFALWRIGRLWRGQRDSGATTAVLYLPAVAGSFVIATIGSGFFGHTFAQIFFGAGFFSWLAIESVLLQRLLTAEELPVPLRPTIGIQLAPPAVGAVAYLSGSSGAPDQLLMAMFGYAILQALLLVRVLPWIMKQPFAGSYWALTFGATALATASIKIADKTSEPFLDVMAVVLFGAGNVAVGLIAIGTLALLFRGRLFPLARTP